MNKLKSFLVLLVLALLSLNGNAETVTRYKMVIDTVSAIQKLKEKYAELSHSNPNESTMNSIDLSSFSKSHLIKMIGFRNVPTKRIAYQHEKRDSEDLSFNELVEKYYNTPEKRKWFYNNGVVKGRFDGIIVDEIGVFPAHEQITSWGEKGYGKLNLVSRYGTIESCLISDSICGEYYLMENGPAEDGLTGGNYRIEELIYPGNLMDAKIGWKLALNPEGSNIQDFMTFYAPDGKIVNTPPVDVEYLSFDECLKLMKNNGHSPELFDLNYITADDFGDTLEAGILTIASVSNADIAGNLYLPGKQCVIAKYKPGTDKSGGEKNISPLVLDNHPYKIEVIKDYFNKGEDGLIIYYERINDTGIYDIEVCRIEGTPGDSEYINGTEMADIAWFKKFVGTYNSNTGQREVKEYEYDDEYEY